MLGLSFLKIKKDIVFNFQKKYFIFHKLGKVRRRELKLTDRKGFLMKRLNIFTLGEHESRQFCPLETVAIICFFET